MLATGVANFLHVRADALDGIEDVAARRWIASSPVIRRRSGVEKFEVDLRRAPRPVRLAEAPLRLVGTVVLSGRESGSSGALLVPVANDDVASCLAVDQAYAMTQPGWHRFERSEEHTSELQSLMRISYAVFCLKKKKNNTPTSNNPPLNKDSYRKT